MLRLPGQPHVAALGPGISKARFAAARQTRLSAQTKPAAGSASPRAAPALVQCAMRQPRQSPHEKTRPAYHGLIRLAILDGLSLNSGNFDFSGTVLLELSRGLGQGGTVGWFAQMHRAFSD